MIVCVSGNPSIDKLFEVDDLVPGDIHRPRLFMALPGGKGIHIAQVTTALGGDAVVTAILAGHTGRWVADTLAAEGVRGRFAWGEGETRSSLSVADRATGQLTEFYEFPYKNAKNPQSGFSPRGSDIDSNGVFWAVLSSGNLVSFDRRLCKGALKGPALADPQNLCPEGFKFYEMPGPEFENLPKGTPGASAEAPYYVWVDQHNVLGLGENVPIATGNNADSLNALVNGKWVVVRIPYPMSFFAKNLDGRIDDMKEGWKGKGLWTQYSGRSQPHLEGGKGQTSKVIHVQYRPDPLAH